MVQAPSGIVDGGEPETLGCERFDQAAEDLRLVDDMNHEFGFKRCADDGPAQPRVVAYVAGEKYYAGFAGQAVMS